MMEAGKNNAIKEKSYKFALRTIKLFQYIVAEKKEGVIAKQVLRSGSAVGALVEEALQGESTQDFIHKLSIANKEANETRYWLYLLKDSQIIEPNPADLMIDECTEIIKLLTAIINTSKKKTSRMRNE